MFILPWNYKSGWPIISETKKTARSQHWVLTKEFLILKMKKMLKAKKILKEKKKSISYTRLANISFVVFLSFRLPPVIRVLYIWKRIPMYQAKNHGNWFIMAINMGIVAKASACKVFNLRNIYVSIQFVQQKSVCVDGDSERERKSTVGDVVPTQSSRAVHIRILQSKFQSRFIFH